MYGNVLNRNGNKRMIQSTVRAIQVSHTEYCIPDANNRPDSTVFTASSIFHAGDLEIVLELYLVWATNQITPFSHVQQNRLNKPIYIAHVTNTVNSYTNTWLNHSGSYQFCLESCRTCSSVIHRSFGAEHTLRLAFYKWKTCLETAWRLQYIEIIILIIMRRAICL